MQLISHFRIESLEIVLEWDDCHFGLLGSVLLVYRSSGFTSRFTG